MWKRDYPSAYSALQAPWSDNVRHIMTTLQGMIFVVMLHKELVFFCKQSHFNLSFQCIAEELRSRAIDLIANAYSSIALSDLAAMAGINDREAERISNERGWIIDAETEMVHPVRPPPSSQVTTSSEGQLNKLTDYVSFLEN